MEIPDEEIELETAIQRINNHVIERVGNFITSVVGDSPIPPLPKLGTFLGNKTPSSSSDWMIASKSAQPKTLLDNRTLAN